MRIAHIRDVTFININDKDVEGLKTGSACTIEDRYFVFMVNRDTNVDALKSHPKLKDKVLMGILPEQLQALTNGDLVSYSDTLKLSMEWSFNQYVKKQGFTLKTVDFQAPKTLQ